MTRSPTKKLFHVVVVVGMGATVASCSSATNDPEDASADVHNDALATKDSSTTDGSVKDVQAVDVSVSDAADACAGWAPCC